MELLQVKTERLYFTESECLNVLKCLQKLDSILPVKVKRKHFFTIDLYKI